MRRRPAAREAAARKAAASDSWGAFSEGDWEPVGKVPPINMGAGILRGKLDRSSEVKFVSKPGRCRKCGKHIGRGVRFHEKACKG